MRSLPIGSVTRTKKEDRILAILFQGQGLARWR